MKRSISFLFALCLTSVLFAQQKADSLQSANNKDSIAPQTLEEVVIIANSDVNYLKENKALGSLDSYLGQSNSINMVKRGAYAAVPMLNGMSMGRRVVTIDGMRIFHACTDKMDPITSYVANTNLSRAEVEEGQSGTQYGATIAGSINLIRKRSGFNPQKKLGGSAFAGFEANNKQQIYGATLNYSSKRYFADIDFTYRDANDYRAGHKSGQNSEVDFSQFTKYNISAITGFKINEKQSIEGSIIYDKATDVGYPGLPMDASLAEAIIASLEYRYRNLSKHLYLWETKVYFNTITHKMDDSHRPDVLIRMDMPSWSKTQGFYSKLLGHFGKNSFKATLSGYRNNSLEEMTMHPNNPNERDMFMLTWPDINTLYTGLNIQDNIALGPHLVLTIEGGIGIHYNEIKSEIGLNSLRVFYPDLEPTKTRILKNISSDLSYHHGHLINRIGIGYGDRAPTVSEGYGYYLLNVNDNYDYVGNPNLDNEKSLNFNVSSSYKKGSFSTEVKANYFYIMDYIIGKPRPGIPSMSANADGVKVYEQLNNASIFNASLKLDYSPFIHWKFSTKASYRYGQGSEHTALPLIQPFSYKIKARYHINKFFAEASLNGSAKNRNSIEFGETQKPAFYIVNLALSKDISLKNNDLIVKLGVENLFDRYYSTFADWFGIPEMGRNIYANLIFKF